MSFAMMLRAMRVSLCVAIGMVASAHLAQADKGEIIGKTARVKGVVYQIYQQETEKRQVNQGDPVYLGDRFETMADSRVKIELADESRFTIGPDAAMEIDEFVYNPTSQDGAVVAKMLKGAFGFVSGKVAKKDPDKMAVKLPVATIGIRGTAAAGKVEGEKAGVALLDPVTTRSGQAGQKTAIILTNSQGQIMIDEYFHGTDITQGTAPTQPKAWSEQRLNTLLAELQDDELRMNRRDTEASYPHPLDWFGHHSYLNRAVRTLPHNRRTF